VRGPTKPRPAVARGVTDRSIKVGIVMVDYNCIKQFVDFNRGDQQATFEVFVNAINAGGGVAGRKIEAVYRTYCPIGNAQALAACTSLTEDAGVFAVIGLLIDFAGDAQLCIARDHKTIHIGHELTQAWIHEAPPGLLLTSEITSERRVDVLMRLLAEKKTLRGHKVAVLADAENEVRARDRIAPALDRMGVDRGSTAVLTVTGSDTAAGQAQLDSFIERWKQEHVDAVVIAGLSLVSRQWVEKIARELHGALLFTDAPSSALLAARDAKKAGLVPNPYEGIYSAVGESPTERWKGAKVQSCVRTFEDATGQKVVGPGELQPGADGKRVEVYAAVVGACSDLMMFQAIAQRAGRGLTNQSWTSAVNATGSVDLVTTKFASLHAGKYDADDGFGLVRYDPRIGSVGDWRAVTPIIDAEKR
jgi:substrate-binding family protein